MSIDWNKPVRLACDDDHRPVRVLAVHKGRAFITWEATDMAFLAHSDGTVLGWRCHVENVPEEPKDHIRLFSWDGGPWRVFANPPGYNDAALFTRTEAEKDARDYSSDPRGRSFAVKVPA